MAHDGDEGLQQVIDIKPDLAILEIFLPKRSGFRIFYEMKCNPITKDIPVMILTNVANMIGIPFSSEDIKEFMGYEPEAYLEKPISPVFSQEYIKSDDK